MKLLRALLTSLKWWVATDEMEELQNLRRAIAMAKREMTEFPDAIDALEYVERSAKWPPGPSLVLLSGRLRDMRARRQRILEGLCTFRTTA